MYFIDNSVEIEYRTINGNVRKTTLRKSEDPVEYMYTLRMRARNDGKFSEYPTQIINIADIKPASSYINTLSNGALYMKNGAEYIKVGSMTDTDADEWTIRTQFNVLPDTVSGT